MGVEVIHLRNNQEQVPSLQVEDLSRLTFSAHVVSNPPMGIWLMHTEVGRPVFPWWTYEQSLDAELQTLAQSWCVNSAQSFFDYLFLSQLLKNNRNGFYALFPGNIRMEGWDELPDSTRATFSRGQGCVYRLVGAYNGKITTNWVPFYQPQSIVKNPSLENFWRLFAASRTDDVATSISFFSTENPLHLPEITALLINPDEKRSEKLSELVDFFGFYSSPIQDDHAVCGAIYSQKRHVLAALMQFQARFKEMLEQTRKEFLAYPHPSTVLRIIPRLTSH